MHTLSKTTFIIGLFVIAHSLVTVAAGDWQLSRQSGGFQVFKRSVEGSSIEEFKVVAELDTPIEIIGEVLRDIPSYPAWYTGCAETRLLEHRDRNHFTFYFLQKTPWPFRYRDLVLRVATDMNLKQGWVEISMQSLPDAAPPRAGVVRAQMLGSYRLEYLARNRTRVTHRMWADPKGSVPVSMANKTMGDRMLQSLQGIVRRVRHPKYAEQAESSEDQKLIEQLRDEGILR
jgi:hypothetical protein